VEALNHQFATAWRGKGNFDHSRAAWFELVQKTFEGSFGTQSVRELFADIYNRFASSEAWRVFDDVRPSLELLRKRGFKLAVISNWDERLRPLLKQLQLTEYFQGIAISTETGFAKPVPEIFQQAAASLGLPARSILHIGDSMAEDVAGAQSAGFQGLLLNRKDDSASGPVTITTLTELEQLLER
jgi:putative hydrolase of the HAD superfamily